MKIYVAGGAQERIEVVQPMLDRLRVEGFIITHDWTTTEEFLAISGDHGLTDDQRRVLALGDLKGIEHAQVVWFMTPSYRGSRGSYLEFGYALARRRLLEQLATLITAEIPPLPLLVVSGEFWRYTIFSELADMKFDSHEEAFEALCTIRVCSKDQ